jgi:hypothetical protein
MRTFSDTPCSLHMFNIFKKKSPQQILQRKYEDLLKRSRDLSTSNRAASDRTFAEAQEVLRQLEELDKNSGARP